jgi:hypothetical protein
MGIEVFFPYLKFKKVAEIKQYQDNQYNEAGCPGVNGVGFCFAVLYDGRAYRKGQRE